MKKKFDITFFFLPLSLLFFSACTKPKEDSIKKVLKVAYISSAVQPLVYPCQTSICSDATQLTSEGLATLQYQENELNLIPALAKSWTLKTPTTLLIQLRDKQKKSDGTQLAATDFINAWKETLSLGNKELALPFFPIAFAKDFFYRKVPFARVGLKALDDLTIEIVLSNSSPNFTWNLAHPSFRIRGTNLLSVGPMAIKNISSQEIILERNPRYWAPDYRMEQIHLRQISKPNLAMNMIEDHEVDLVVGNPLGSLFSESYFYPKQSGAILLFNTEGVGPKSVAIRKWLMGAINLIHLVKLEDEKMFATATLDPFYEKDSNPNRYYKPNSALPLASLNRFSFELYYPQQLNSLATHLKMQWLKELSVSFQLIAWDQAKPFEPKKSNAIRIHLLPIYRSMTEPILVFETLMGYANHLEVYSLQSELSDIIKKGKSLPLQVPENLHDFFQATETKLISEQGFYLPIVQNTRSIYHLPGLKGLKALPLGGLNFSEVHF